MVITAEQLENRRGHIGSSDVAAICGCDTWKSAMDVYLEKTQQTESFTNPAIEVGNLLEPVLMAWAADQLGVGYEPNVVSTHPGGILEANLDAWIDESRHIEGKTTGITEGWGDPEVTDDVPKKVLLQVHHQFACAGTRICYVPVALAHFGIHFKLYKVERSQRLHDLVIFRCEAFWNDYVVPRIPPPDSMPSLDVVKRIVREPNRIITDRENPELYELVIKYEKALEAFFEAEAWRDGTKAKLIAGMDAAEELRSSAGRYTYFQQSQKGGSLFRVLRKRKG